MARDPFDIADAGLPAGVEEGEYRDLGSAPFTPNKKQDLTDDRRELSVPPDDWAEPVSDKKYGEVGTNRPDLIDESDKKAISQYDFKDFSVFPDSFLIINDVYLTDIPTASISIKSPSDTFVAETLRSQAPIVLPEGRQEFVVTMSLPFPPGGKQQEELFKIVSVITKHPLVFIYNNKIRRNLGVPEFETTMFMLETASLRSVSDSPGLIVLDLTLLYFNHKPFSNNFYFNAKLGGLERPRDERIENVDGALDLTELQGYEASDYTLKYATERLLQDVRDSSLEAFENKKANVPVNFPSESDAWMWYAQNLRQQAKPIAENYSDYVGFSINHYSYVNPPGKDAQLGNTNIYQAFNEPQEFKPVTTPYQYFETEFPKTAQDRRIEETLTPDEQTSTSKSDRIEPSKDQLRVKPGKRPPVTIYSNAHKITKKVQLVDEDGFVHPTAVQEIYDVVKPLQRRYQGQEQLKPATIILLQKIADQYPNKRIIVISAIRAPKEDGKRGRHVVGEAMDISIPGVSKRSLFEFLKTLPYCYSIYYSDRVICHFNTRNKFTPGWQENGPGDKYLKSGTTKLAYGSINFEEGTAEANSDRLDQKLQEIREQQEKQNQAADVSSTKGNIASNITNKVREAQDKQATANVSKNYNSNGLSIDRDKWIFSMAQSGLHYYSEDPKIKNVFYETLHVDVSSNPEAQRQDLSLRNIVCSSVNVTFGHRIAPLRLVGQEYTTYQFLGPGNKVGQLVFTFVGKAGRVSADKIKDLVRKARSNAVKFNSLISDAGTIKLHTDFFIRNEQNTILSLAGIENIVVTNMEEASHPESADKHQLIIEFISQEFAEESFDKRFATSLDSKRKIIKGLMKHIKIRQSKKTDGSVLEPDYHSIYPSPQIASTIWDQSYDRPYKVKQGVPSWVATAVIKAVEACKKADEAAPSTKWKTSRVSSKRWADVYSEWGAADIITGRVKNIPDAEQNIEITRDYAETSGTPIVPRARGGSSTSFLTSRVNWHEMYNGNFDNDGGSFTNKVHKDVYEEWLRQMELIVREVREYVTDEENFEKYIGSVGSDLLDTVTAGLGECYNDMFLPPVPGTDVPLPPEFYVYDDSDQDPLTANSTDPKNLEKLLNQHITHETESLKHYLKDTLLGGSYISKNLPRTLMNRKAELKNLSGEQSFFENFAEIYSEGAKAWEPVFYRYDDSFNQGSGQDWLKFVKSNLGEGSEDQQRLEFMSRITKLSSYIKEGRPWESGDAGLDDQSIVTTLYGDAWNKLSFGPSPEFSQVDAILDGQIPTPQSKAAKEALMERTAAQSATSDKPIELPNGRTVLSDGTVLVGNTEEEKQAADKSVLDQVLDFGWNALDFATGNEAAAILLAPLTGGATLAINLFRNVKDAIASANLAYKNLSLNKLLDQVNETIPVKDQYSDSARSISKMTSNIALTTKKNDLSIRRVYPTFKIYFIEDDTLESEGNWDRTEDGQVIRAWDDFNSYSAIQELRITRSRKIPSDLAVIRMTNVAGKLLRKRFGEQEPPNPTKGIGAEKQGIFADTEREDPFERMILQDGIKVQIRLGYNSNPDLLETVFLGQIVEISPSENGRILEIMCQGYGAELESVELGPLDDGPVFFSSQQVLSSAIIQDSIANFGRQSKYGVFNPAEVRHGWTGGDGVFLGVSPATLLQRWAEDNLDAQFNKYRFLNYPQDDNIFAPPPSVYTSTWDRFYNNACIYRPLKQTPWEIFKEHELRHPGYISLAVPYGHSPRMTMFFGAKGQHYWSRPPSNFEMEISKYAESNIVRMRGINAHRINSDVNPLLSKIKEFSAEAPSLARAMIQDLVSGSGATNIGKELGKMFGRYVPFRNYHWLDSEHHILKNNIRTSIDGTFNEVEVLYFKDENLIEEDDAEDLARNIEDLRMGEEGVLSTKLDENIPEKDIRSYREDFPSCVTTTMAKRYTQGIFSRTLRDTYKGELCVIGKETIKPYDICMCRDSVINMVGPIEVEAVTHIFNRDSGFVSIITPDLCVDINEYFSASIFDTAAAALWWINGLDKQVPTESEIAIVENPIAMLAAAAGVKLLMWTQDGAPVITTPLTFGGKPFVSSTLGRRKVSLFLSLHGKWNQYWDDLGDAWRKFDLAEAIFDTRLNLSQKFLNIFRSDLEEA